VCAFVIWFSSSLFFATNNIINSIVADECFSMVPMPRPSIMKDTMHSTMPEVPMQSNVLSCCGHRAVLKTQRYLGDESATLLQVVVEEVVAMVVEVGDQQRELEIYLTSCQLVSFRPEKFLKLFDSFRRPALFQLCVISHAGIAIPHTCQQRVHRDLYACQSAFKLTIAVASSIDSLLTGVDEASLVILHNAVF
jgi:hypothetical protein